MRRGESPDALTGPKPELLAAPAQARHQANVEEKRGEPHDRLRGATDPQRSVGASRRGGERPRGRNAGVRWHGHPEGKRSSDLRPGSGRPKRMSMEGNLEEGRCGASDDDRAASGLATARAQRGVGLRAERAMWALARAQAASAAVETPSSDRRTGNTSKARLATANGHGGRGESQYLATGSKGGTSPAPDRTPGASQRPELTNPHRACLQATST
jgi:hypothetical protein